MPISVPLPLSIRFSEQRVGGGVFILQAFMDHGTVARTVDQDLAEAHAVLQKLKEVRTAPRRPKILLSQTARIRGLALNDALPLT